MTFALLCMVVQGAWGWDGSGTSDDPYLIQTTADWQTLAADVNKGNSYSGKVFRMTKDIDAEGAMVGSYEDAVMRAFSGIFDGDGHTLTFSAGEQGEPVNETTAPFRYVSGATIRHLHTTGEIYTRDWFTAGIVARIVGPGSTQLYDCHSSIQLLIAQGGTMYDGGLVGQVQSMTSSEKVESVVIDRCSFTGALLHKGAKGEIKSCGGLVGTIGKDIAVTIRNSIFDPQGWTYHDVVKDGATFARAETTKLLTLENCYATYQMSTSQGTFIVNEMMVPDGVTYEFQGEPDVTLNGKGYWTNGCRVKLTVPSGTSFNHWYDNNRCFISDPWTKDGIHQLKDLNHKPDLSIVTHDIPEAETQRTLWVCHLSLPLAQGLPLLYQRRGAQGSRLGVRGR